MSDISPYQHGREHLADEWIWLDAGLQALLDAGGGDPFADPAANNRGLYITEEELRDPSPDGPEATEIWESYTRFRRAQEHRIRERVHISLQAGIHLPLPRLAAQLGLTVWECRFLVLCLAGEWNRKYEKWYGYLNDDITCRCVTPDLALRLLADQAEDRQYGRERLGGNGVLRRLLLEPADDSAAAGQPIRPRLKSPLRLDQRTVSYLLETETLDARLEGIVTAYEPEEHASEWPGGDEIYPQMLATTNPKSGLPIEGFPFLYLWGPVGGGKSTRLRHLAAARNQRLLLVKFDMLPQDADNLRLTLSRIVREAAFTDAAVLFEEGNFTPGTVSHKTELLAAFRDYSRFVRRPLLAWTSRQERRRGELPVPDDALYRSWNVGVPDASERITVWKQLGADEQLASELGDKLRFTHGQIISTWNRALVLASDRGADKPSLDDLELAARTQFNHRLAELADPIKPTRSWDSLVLPPETLSLLKEACNRFLLRETVLGRWGFGRKLPYGTGVHLLFAGPPGTGKTMSAEIVAKELGLELYRIDLSRIVSKYIGETEQRLKELFDEAERSRAILFFDEGDALFGKRTEVKDANDRYANMEAAYLLQRIEAYDGVTILATNLLQNLDEAMFRRMSFIIKFPAPTAEDRERIFQAHLPPEAPLADDIDLEFLASRLEVSGGQIKNIVLAAAFMAAAEQMPIGMRHLVRAAGQELRKMGKIFMKEAFAPYAEDL
jgi:hypothetical protein